MDLSAERTSPAQGGGKASKLEISFEALPNAVPPNLHPGTTAAKTEEDGDSVVSVSTAGLSDSPSDQDQIGFSPYVRAVYRFLTSKETKAPLTMSIEGRWGSGKSSFMLQLASKLRANERPPAESPAGKTEPPALTFWVRLRTWASSVFSLYPPAIYDRHYTIWFNAWRFDKDESLWASFALVLIQQLNKQVPTWQRLKANAGLTLRRFDIAKGKWTLLQLAAFVLAFGVLWLMAVEDPTSIIKKLAPAAKDPKTIGAGALALAVWAYTQAKKFLGNPLERDLKKFVRDPGYHDKLPFAERFQEDFARILKSYVGSGRVYVFIDDLDRAEVPRAADLMQAINMLISADQQLQTKPGALDRAPANLFFVLGIDRQVIAAGIAAKSEKLIPYIASARSIAVPETGSLARLGVDYGYEFLEKFIQVSFRIPHMDTAQVGNWVASLTGDQLSNEMPPPAPAPAGPYPSVPNGGRGPGAMPTAMPPGPYPGELPLAGPPLSAEINRVAKTFNFSSGVDPQGFSGVVTRVTGELGFNPRKIKQFINVLRLQVLVLIETGRLVPAEAGAGSTGPVAGLTLEKIALASAILMKWPVLVRDLTAAPGLLAALASPAAPSASAYEGTSEAEIYWRSNAGLMSALQLGGAYSLQYADLRPLLELVSDADSRQATWVGAGGRPGRLVPQQSDFEGSGSSPYESSAPPTSSSPPSPASA